MTAMRFRAVLAATMLCLGAGAADAGNILLNPGFESGSLGPWYDGRVFSGSEPWNVVSTSPHSGTFAATTDGNRELRQDFAAVATSDITEVSFWVMHPSQSASAAAYVFFYGDGTQVQNIVSTSGTDYNFFDVTAELAAGKTLVGFSIYGNSGGRTYFDDAVINVATAAVPEPSSVMLLGAGGLAVAAGLRRRRSA